MLTSLMSSSENETRLVLWTVRENMPLTPPTERGSNPYQNFAGFSGRWIDNQAKPPRTQLKSEDENLVEAGTAAEKPETQNKLGATVTNNQFSDFDDSDDYKDESVYTFCGSCKNHVITEVRFRVGKTTVISAGMLCVLGCAAGCCLMPFLLSRFSDVVHSCPNCQIKLGKYRRKFKHIFTSSENNTK